MACSSAACVLGGVRLISSASSTWAKTGPATNRNVRRPVVWSSSSTSVPVMSEGIRSGVNWMRLKVSESASARVEIKSVLARPGTPTNRQWPREKRAIRSCSIPASWPTTRLPISCAIRVRARASSSISSASEAVPSAPLIANSLMVPLFRRDSCRQRERLPLPLFQRRVLQSSRDLHVARVQIGVEGVHRNSVVERQARLVQRAPLEQHPRVERLRRLVVRIVLHRTAQRLLRLREAPELHLRERVAPRELRNVAREPGARPSIFLGRGRPPAARIEDLAQPRRLLRFRVLGLGPPQRGGTAVERRWFRSAFGVFLEDELLGHRRANVLLRYRLRPRLLHFRPPVLFELLEALSIRLRHRLLFGHAGCHRRDQLGERRLPPALVEQADGGLDLREGQRGLLLGGQHGDGGMHLRERDQLPLLRRV